MANRFLETNYYKSTFVRSLKGALKGLYSFIICDCTPSGIWNKDIEAASMYIGFTVTDIDFEEAFVLTDKAIDIGRGKYFFPDFIEHQYPKGLQEKNPAHSKVIIDLQKLDILDENLKIKRKKNKDPLKELKSSIGNGNGNVMDKVMAKDVPVEKKTFNTKPLSSDFNGLPTQYITSSIEFVFQTSQSLITNENVIKLWEIFKIQNLTGEDYYPNEGKVYNHFTNWIKKQKFANGNQSNNGSTGKQGVGTARIDALKKW